MGFLQPGALAWSILFGVLIALYLQERHRNSLEVPSLLLWQSVPEVPPRATRFQWDPLFLLRCLLLAALILGLADPYLGRAGDGRLRSRHVFILDTSASMQSREGRSSRFELARGELRRRLGSLGEEDEAMLIAADHAPRVISPFTRDHDALIGTLESIRPVDAASDLDLALAVAQHAAGADRDTKVELFTDLPRSALRRGWGDRILLRRFGESDRNVAIEALQVLQGAFQNHTDARSQVVIRNYSGDEAHGVLTLTLNGHLLERQGFSLPAHGARVFYRRGFSAPGILKAEIETDDALAADNRSYGRVRPMEPIRLLAVTDDTGLRSELERVGAATPNLEVDTILPAEYGGKLQGRADILFLHGHLPDVPPNGASLLVYPEEGSDWLPVQATAQNLEVTDWNQKHPVLRGLRPELPFPLRQTRLLTRPSWADMLMATEKGGREFPLAFCGKNGSDRMAVIGFDLASDPLLHPDHTNLLLFFLRLLEWLAPAEESIRVLRTGEAYVLPGGSDQSVEVTDPYGRPVPLPASGPPRIEASLAGLYDVEIAGQMTRLLANFFDPRESDIGRKNEPPDSPAKTKRASKVGPPRDAAGLGFLFYAGAMALFLLEWFAAMRRR